MRLIIFEGTAEELNQFPGLKQLLSLSEGTASRSDDNEVAGNDQEPPFKSERRALKPAIALRFLRQIKPEARKALLYIATNGPEVTFAEVAAHLGVNGSQLGGTLTSLTFQSSKLGISIGLERDYRSRSYRIDPDAAKAILEANEKFSSRGQARGPGLS